MAMTGLRTVTTGLGVLEQTPPDAVVREGETELGRQLPAGRRAAVVELAHWAYGAAAGAAFGLLPARVRSSDASGPLYGLAIWLGFELAIAPSLRVDHAARHRVAGRVALALDHVLYGVVVAGGPAPARPTPGRQGR